MSNSVRCIITDCKSNALKDLDLKFFRFPSQDSRLYAVWVDICYGSVHAIRKHPRPYICSKHFRGRDVGFRRLAHNAVPTLNLNNPPRCIVDQKPTLDSALTPEQVEKTRLVRLLNETVIEWARRGQHYSLMSIPKTDLIKVATKIRKMLGPKLTLNLDNYWCNKLRSRLCRVQSYDRTSKRCSILDLELIIKELDPLVKIYRDTEAAEESEKKADTTKEHLEKRRCCYAPKIREGLGEKSDVGVFKCEFTTRPTKAKDDDKIGSPNFSGKKYVKKTKPHTNTKLNISGSDPFIDFLKKKNVLTNFESGASSDDSQKTSDYFELASKSNEGLDQTSHSISPLVEVKKEIMEDQSGDCRIFLGDSEFCAKTINSEGSENQMSNDGVSVRNNVDDKSQIENPAYDLRKEAGSDDKSLIRPDYSNASVLDEVSNYLFLEHEKIVPEIFLQNEIIQSISSIERISPEIEDKSIEHDDIFKTSYKVIDLTQSVRNVAEVDSEISLECDITPSSTTFTENVLQEKAIGSNGDKVIKTKPPNTNKGFLDNYLNYIRDYGQPKPKLSIPWVSKCPVRLKQVTEPSRRSSTTSKLNNDNKKQVKQPKRTRLQAEFIKDINIKIITKAKETHPSKDSLVENEPVQENSSELKLNNVSPVSGSQLNVEAKKDDTAQVNRANPSSSCEIPLDIDDTNQLEISPYDDAALQDNSNDKDGVRFDGDWISDDSTSGERPQSKITSYMKALDYLKPLEDFVLRKEDFRAIGLVSNLEIHFKQRATLRREKM